MITVQNLIDFAPEFANMDGPQIASIVGFANLQLDADVWGDWLEMGQLYLAAHLATMGVRRGAGGALQSERVGQVSRAFAVSAVTPSALGSTGYGQEYARLVNLLPDVRGPWVI